MEQNYTAIVEKNAHFSNHLKRTGGRQKESGKKSAKFLFVYC